MSVMMQEGAPRDSYTREVPLNVTLYGCMVALLSFLIIWLGVLCFVPRDAYAFTIGDDTYPDTLDGYTVTLNSVIYAPPNSICGNWYSVNLFPVRGSAAPGNPQTAATSITLYFENEQTVSSGHPWYFYANCGQSLTGVTYIPNGVDYAARFGYDGTVMAWWGLDSSVTRPTITFASYGSGNSPSLYADRDFIVWIVENSDWRSRYEGDQWVSPVTSRSGNTLAWLVDENNVAFTGDIQYRPANGSWSTVSTIDSVYYGTYTLTQDGDYRIVYYYSINGLSRSESSSIYSYAALPSSVLTIDHVTVNPVRTGYVNLFVTGSNIVSLQLQYRTSSSQAWRTLDVTFFENNGGWQSIPVGAASGQFRVIAYDGANNSVEYGPIDFDISDEVNNSFADYIVQLVEYVQTFLQHIPDLFAWMPTEIRGILIACFAIMIVLGLIGWLKS